MAKRIRIITTAIDFGGIGWTLDGLPNPGVPAGYYIIRGDGVAPRAATVTITGNQNIQLYDDSDIYIGTFTIADLPAGFQVNSIAQPLGNGIPAGNASGGLTTYPILVAGGSVINSWDAGALGISNAGFVYVPATMSYPFASGIWIFNAAITVALSTSATGLIASQTYNSLSALQPQIQKPAGINADVPLMMYEGIWTADESLCPVIDPLPTLQIDDPVTGEFSWTLPSGTGGVVITLSRTGFDDVVVSVLSPTLNYLPVNMFGTVNVSIKPLSTFPICYGPASTLVLSIITPLDYIMGTDGIGSGMDLGGAAIIQAIGNPSGIYTLVSGQAYDTLYERIPVVSSQDVKIPDPFIKTAFVGE
jgi:hypothetical protein